MESFDHVKKELKIEEEGEAEKDPAFFLKTEGLSEDMKRVMAKLYTPDALKASRLPVFCPDMEDMWTYNGRHVDCEFRGSQPCE